MTLDRTLRAAALVVAAALAAACRGTGYWESRLQSDPLYRRAEKVVQSPACSALVPTDFGRSFPVPVRGSPGRFEVLFYPLFVSPGKSEAMTPAFEARFSLDASAAVDCGKLPAAPPVSLGAPVPAGLSMKAYYRAETKLFASLRPTAALYAAGGAPSAVEKETLAGFADAFTTLAEPGLLPDYYRMNPDFWEWLKRETGRSIAKPAS